MSTHASGDPAIPAAIASPQAKLVYLYLSGAGGATAAEAARALDLPQLSVLGVLRTLARRDLVRRRGDEYVLA